MSAASQACPPPQREKPSILILTKDEQVNIADCIRSCAGLSDDIVVLDSYSTDRTVDIARTFANVRVVQRVFDTEYVHRNFGLHEIEYRHPWLYIVDADERVPSALADEIIHCINDPAQGSYAAYRVTYCNMFRGKWIRFASGYPVWLIRLVRPGLVSYEARETNVHPVVQGPLGELRNAFVHYSFSKGLAPWFAKHNYYSEMEARAAIKITKGEKWPWLGRLFDRDRGVRRRAMKNLSFFMPMRALARLIYISIIRLGFLDGMAGLHYALMISVYEYWLTLKMKELRSDWRDRDNRLAARLLKNGAGAAPSSHATSGRVEVMIPTLNEADHIMEVVTNALLLGPVFVLDSGSTDGTQELARKAGATVVEHPFVDYSTQKNWGLDNLPFQGDWIFILDADERITPGLRAEIQAAIDSGPPVVGYFINRLSLIMGGAIRHGGMYPSWNLRLLKRGACRYENRSVHEHMICNGPTAYLSQEMLHVRREDLSRFIAKHIRYAEMESTERLKSFQGQSQGAPPLHLFPGIMGQRQWLRRIIFPRLPGTPFWRFFYMYFVRLGFLDGARGWHLACLMAGYEYMIVLLTDEKVAAARQERPEMPKVTIAP